MSKARILLAEDDASLGFIIKDNLELASYHVDLYEDGISAWKAFTNSNFDLCVLDVMLPGKDGFSIAADIRKQNEQVPILFLTARAMKDDRITGFKTGGDDYITKPFSIEELLLRIEVFLKRSKAIISDRPVFQLGDFVLDHNNLTLKVGNDEIVLTQKEGDILKMFCQNTGLVLKREDILNKIWGDDDYFTGRSLDVFISRIRKYLKPDPSIEIINQHGIGFKLIVKA
jgi:DNA-binding response OmpR family regulator